MEIWTRIFRQVGTGPSIDELSPGSPVISPEKYDIMAVKSRKIAIPGIKNFEPITVYIDDFLILFFILLIPCFLIMTLLGVNLLGAFTLSLIIDFVIVLILKLLNVELVKWWN